ncbi:cytochrome P450 [Streptomyces diacarni]|uniref:Cytochrome P450 n=2 Tax=Streptomyces diacarni TaxID=2800381 RepID=A0A367F4Y3_9ACTN|nr:cytochrome P450 [Streptomyces diacarni]
MSKLRAVDGTGAMSHALPDTPDLLSEEYRRSPYPIFDTLRRHHPLLYDARLDAWIISRYEDVTRAFRDADVFSSRSWDDQLRPLVQHSLMAMDGEEHTRHRRLISPAFQRKRLTERISSSIEASARQLVHAFAAEGSADFAEHFSRRLPVRVIMRLLGVSEDNADFRRWYRAIVDYSGNFDQNPEVTRAGLAAGGELAAFLDEQIRRRRADPGEDLISLLCTSEVDGARMTDDMIKSFGLVLLAAGGETTEKALNLTVCHLLDNRLGAAASTEERLLDRALAETLRLTPPVQVITRVTREAVTLSGGNLPAGALVFLLVGAANRDPARFERPDTFDVYRKDAEADRAFAGAAQHLAFGSGRHFCVGASLAHMEITTALRVLFDMLPGLRLSPGFVPQDVGFVTRGPRQVLIEFPPVSAHATR